MKKISNIKLIGLLAGLCILYFVVDFTGDKQKSKSLRTTLVEIDSAQVSGLEIEGPSNSVSLAKVGDQWELTLKDGKKVAADEAKIKSALAALMTISPSRMATKSKNKWGEYQVDSTGTRVMVKEGSKNSLDIVLGKFGMEGQRAYHTFVRLFEDQEVYVAKNFMGFSVPSDPASYRNQSLASIQMDSVLAVNFTYPADSSVRLERVGDIWNVNGQLADSTATVSYLNGLSFVSGKEFMDEDPAGLIAPTLTASFEMINGDNVSIDAYDQNGSWIFHSSANEESYFRDAALLDKVFKGLSAFQ